MQAPWTVELARAGFALLETHVSRVFLRDDDVFKTKREVDLGFLDFTSLEARRAACHAEVELNRRMAPDVYLGVVALVRSKDGGLTFAPETSVGDAAVLEWAVHMKRLADDDRCDILLSRDQLSVADVARIAQTLATFHATARRDEATAHSASAEAIEVNVEENFAQLRGRIDAYVRPSELDTIARAQRAFLRTQRALIERRAREGFARDGHGDLRLEHLYRTTEGGFIAIDCIEFNDRFRFADVCADLAFLTMDLTVHRRPDLAELLAAYYAEQTSDFESYALLDFYQSYRALVRAKVSILLASDPEVTQEARDRGARDVRRHIVVALAAGRPPVEPRRLIVTFGLIASGKSSVASGLREHLHIPVVSTDRIRKHLLGMSAMAERHDEPFSGAYDAETTARVYGEVAKMAELVLCSGRSVVVDGSFRSSAERTRMMQLGERLGVTVRFVECCCPSSVAEQRLAQRASAPSVSDGRTEIYDVFARSYDAPSEIPGDSYLRLDTNRPPRETLDEALRFLT